MSKIEIDQTEYRALCDLRDGEYERVKLRAKEFEEHYRAALKINEMQVSRLAKQDLQMTDLHRRAAALEREITRLTGELAQKGSSAGR